MDVQMVDVASWTSMSPVEPMLSYFGFLVS